MGKSMTGPDMRDCAPLMWEIENEWGLNLSILLELDGSVGGCGLYVHVVGVPKMPIGLSTESGVSASMRWPDREGRTFAGLLVQLLHTADHLLMQDAARKDTPRA
jgi:hypothetical protein